jgi:hypothetical protein
MNSKKLNQNTIPIQIQIQNHKQTEIEYDFNKYLIEERDNDIHKILYDSKLLNEIVKELSVIVNTQDEQINEISKSTKNAKQKTKNALKQVEKNEDYNCCYLCRIC